MSPGTELGFIQTWGEGLDGEQVFGNLNTDGRARGRLGGAQELQSELEKAFSDKQTKDKLAKEFAGVLVSNIIGFRQDTHEENWAVTRDADGNLKILPIDNGLSGQAPLVDRLDDFFSVYARTTPGRFLASYLEENPEMEDEISGVVQDWFTNLQKWLESEGRNQFGSGGISGKELGRRAEAYKKLAEKLADMTPEDFWLSIVEEFRVFSSPSMSAMLRKIYEDPSYGWYGEF